MSAISLVFPHQLFEDHPALKTGRTVFIIEEVLFFQQYTFHKQKLIFHRASMKAYSSFLQNRGYNVTYIDASDVRADVRNLLLTLGLDGVTEIHYADVNDCWLQQRIEKQAREMHLAVVRHDSPMFLLTRQDVDEYFGNRKRLFQTDFYIHQRKRFRVLVDEDHQPVGGKWSFDAENRLRYPKGKKAPGINFPKADSFWREAQTYVGEKFSSNYGRIDSNFIYPATFEASREWFRQFLKVRFAAFGEFEDAIVARENVLHHSVLTPMLNVGLLTPGAVIDQAIQFANENSVPINSLEGFVRQILGWREFIRGVYQKKGVTERTTNYWKFSRRIPLSFWMGTTGIAPVDITIKKVLDTGYCHHIERLMVLGNFMVLCEFDPDDVYRWFMELFIDAYDWVMVPNVYGMSQFADGGLMATKPYISGSNYLMKMSDYAKGEWQPIWDGLFWRFLHRHREFFLKNPRLSMLVRTFDKMPDKKQKEHLLKAEEYLRTLDNSSPYGAGG